MPCDLLNEAVYEDTCLKRHICTRLCTVCKPSAVVVSNTLDVNVLAPALVPHHQSWPASCAHLQTGRHPYRLQYDADRPARRALRDDFGSTEALVKAVVAARPGFKFSAFRSYQPAGAQVCEGIGAQLCRYFDAAVGA